MFVVQHCALCCSVVKRYIITTVIISSCHKLLTFDVRIFDVALFDAPLFSVAIVVIALFLLTLFNIALF